MYVSDRAGPWGSWTRELEEKRLLRDLSNLLTGFREVEHMGSESPRINTTKERIVNQHGERDPGFCNSR